MLCGTVARSSGGPGQGRHRSYSRKGLRKGLTDLEKCPACDYLLVERKTFCPHCGEQLTHPLWKKTGAWILLILIVYGLAKCNIRLLDGLDKF